MWAQPKTIFPALSVVLIELESCFHQIWYYFVDHLQIEPVLQSLPKTCIFHFWPTARLTWFEKISHCLPDCFECVRHLPWLSDLAWLYQFFTSPLCCCVVVRVRDGLAGIIRMAWRMSCSYIIHVPSLPSGNPVAKSRMTGVPRHIQHRCKITHTPLWSIVEFGHKIIGWAEGFFECAHPRPVMWQE